MRAIERIGRCVARIPEGAARHDAEHRLSGVLAIADQMIACAPAPSPVAIRQARSTNWWADRSVWTREEQEWIAARDASTDSVADAHDPEPRPDRGAPGAPGASNEADDHSPGSFDPAEALQDLHGHVIQLEAMTHAASEAVTQLPFPKGREDRRVFDRAYALVTKVAEETCALVRYGDELISALAVYLQRRRAEADDAAAEDR